MADVGVFITVAKLGKITRLRSQMCCSQHCNYCTTSSMLRIHSMYFMRILQIIVIYKQNKDRPPLLYLPL